MKSRTRKVIASCAAVIIIAVGWGAFWISLPFSKIRELDARYSTLSKGMHRNEVIAVMRSADFMQQDGAAAWWDDQRLGPEANARVNSSICYTVQTFFLPVTFEFTFNESGELVGRHRYD